MRENTHLLSQARQVVRRFLGWRRPVLAAVAGAVVAACGPVPDDELLGGVMRLFSGESRPDVSVLERTTEYTVIPPSRALVHMPDAVLVFQRSFGDAIDQKVVLPNDTALRGDNTIRLRAQTRSTARLNEFSYAEVVARFGGLPAPFQNLSENAMRSGRDSLGSYVYATQQVGVDTNCVLVMRRLTGAARPLPRGTEALDVVMRNCVQGTAEQAMAPLGERALGVRGATQRDIHTLSPHAAPRG
ncbi:MAG: cellulose biosynthesis protein BcsN [Pararhodobacter sp.]|nr:cellulose biosynthesis protein BcsN [Pararhodobacter sp.]